MQRSRDNFRNDRNRYRDQEREEQDQNFSRGAESYRPQTEDYGYYTHPYNDYGSRYNSAASQSSYRDTRENWDPNRRNYYDQGRTLSDTGIGTGFSSERAPHESNRYQDAQRSSSAFDRDATYGSYYGPDAARAGSFGTSNYRDNDMNYGSDRYGSERYSGQNYGGSQNYNQGSRGQGYGQGGSYRSDRGGMGRLSYDRNEDYSSAQSYGYGSDIDRFTARSSETEEGYGRDWNSYDSGRITTGPNYAGRGPKGFTRSDERIKEEINDALMRHAGIDASEIEVEVKDGMVTLTGTVPERRMKHMAEDISERSFSVKDVTNNIRVKKESQSSSTSSSTSASAASKKGGNPAATGSGH